MNFKNDRVVILILSVICIIFIGVTTIKSEVITPIRAFVGYILMPIQKSVNVAGKSVYNLVVDYENLSNALTENENLKIKIAELTEENTKLEANSFELERLRNLYQLDTEYMQYEKIGARIIAKDSGRWFRVFRIDKGRKDGIAVDMNVIADGGLIGIVTDVGDNYATVRSIIDDVSRVSAMSISTGDTCIIAGDLMLYEEGRIRISDIKQNANIQAGDKIVTSNISTKYLPGLLIGYVSEVSLDDNRLTSSGYLVPVASFDTLQEVLVVKGLKSDESGVVSQ